MNFWHCFWYASKVSGVTLGFIALFSFYVGALTRLSDWIWRRFHRNVEFYILFFGIVLALVFAAGFAVCFWGLKCVSQF